MCIMEKQIKNNVEWFDTEWCDRADETIQPVSVNGTLFYVLFDRRGYNYVFSTIYKLHLFFSGIDNTYIFTCDDEETLNKFIYNKMA